MITYRSLTITGELLFPGPLALLKLPQHLLFMEDIFLVQIVTVCAENLGKESAKHSFPSNSHPILPPRRRRREKKTKICFRSIRREWHYSLLSLSFKVGRTAERWSAAAVTALGWGRAVRGILTRIAPRMELEARWPDMMLDGRLQW